MLLDDGGFLVAKAERRVTLTVYTALQPLQRCAGKPLLQTPLVHAAVLLAEMQFQHAAAGLWWTVAEPECCLAE